jgi:MFS transporter, DHA1 family, tetracycline resistance protein
VDVLGLTIILPLLPFYAEHFGATPGVVGLLVSTYALCQLVSGPMLGRLSDRMGRRPLLLVSQVGTFIGFLILANAWSLWVVFLSRVIDGVTAGNLSLAQAYISDVTTPEKRAKSFAVIGIAFGLGFLIGPAISGYLSQFGYAVPIYVAAGLSFTSIVCTYFLLPRHRPEHDGSSARRFAVLDWGNYVRFFRQPGLGSLLFQFFAFTIGFSAYMSGFALFAERRYVWAGHPFGPREVGYVYAFGGLLGIIYQGGLVGRAVSLLGERRMVRIAWAVCVAGYAWVGWTWTLLPLLGAATLLSVGTGSLRPVLTSLITQKAGRSETGAVLGLTQSLMAVSQIIAPFIAGMLIQKGLLISWAMFPAAVSLIGLLL